MPVKTGLTIVHQFYPISHFHKEAGSVPDGSASAELRKTPLCLVRTSSKRESGTACGPDRRACTLPGPGTGGDGHSLGTGPKGLCPYPGCVPSEMDRKNGKKVHRHLIQCVPSRSRRSSCTESIDAACSLRCRPVSGAGVPPLIKVSALFLKIWCQSPGCGSKQVFILRCLMAELPL